MKALLLKDIGKLILSEIPIPRKKKGYRLIKTVACGLCRTDAKMFCKGQRDLKLPRILGHEICGIDTISGKRIVVWPGISCGTCILCRNGNENLCANMEIIGFSRDGGLAEYISANSSTLIPIPDNLDSFLATLAEPFACALNALEKIKNPGKFKAVIFGGGPMGLIISFLMSRMKNSETVLVEPRLGRYSSAKITLKGTGARITRSIDIDEKFDISINATSDRTGMEQSIVCLKFGGKFCFFSGVSGEIKSFDKDIINEIHYRELSVHGAYGCTRRQMRDAVSIIAENQDFAGGLISGVIPLANSRFAIRNILDGKGMKWIIKISEKDRHK